MRSVGLIGLTLIAVLGVRATTLSDNLAAATLATEQISGSNWVAAGFETGSSSYSLDSATFLMQRDLPGTLSIGLYSSAVMQPANNLSFEPGALLGNLGAPASFPSLLGPVTFGGNGLMLDANKTYWLVMSAGVTGSYEWAYEAGDSGSGGGFDPSWGISTDGGKSWFTSSAQPMQMRVIGTPVSAVPEPNAYWLVLFGAALILACHAGAIRSTTSWRIGKCEDHPHS